MHGRLPSLGQDTLLHMTAHHGLDRTIFVGPPAHAISLAPSASIAVSSDLLCVRSQTPVHCRQCLLRKVL